MPEARSESNSESNKKRLVRNLIHFLRRKKALMHKTVLIKYMLNLIAHLMLKRLSFISVNL
jgi:hypothetical protein